jgi:hypothetical protein
MIHGYQPIIIELNCQAQRALTAPRIKRLLQTAAKQGTGTQCTQALHGTKHALALLGRRLLHAGGKRYQTRQTVRLVPNWIRHTCGRSHGVRIKSAMSRGYSSHFSAP